MVAAAAAVLLPGEAEALWMLNDEDGEEAREGGAEDENEEEGEAEEGDAEEGRRVRCPAGDAPDLCWCSGGRRPAAAVFVCGSAPVKRYSPQGSNRNSESWLRTCVVV